MKVDSGLVSLYMHFDIHKLVRIDCGSAFHNFEAEYEKERSYNAVRDLIFNECAISSFKDVFELFNASMHPFKTCAICK